MDYMIFSEDHIIILAEYQTPQEHQHFAKHLLFGVNEALTCVIDGSHVEGRGICIESNATHTAKTVSGKMLLVLIEESSSFSGKLTALLENHSNIVLQQWIVDAIVAAYKADGLQGVENALFQAFNLEHRDSSKYDSRIKEVLQTLQERDAIESDIFQQLCRRTALSQSRLSHLFKEQVKISLSGYIALVKMRKAAKYVFQGETLTAAAHHAGFSSSAHMAATCKRMFGLSLSELLSTK